MTPEVVDLSDVTWLQNELARVRMALAQAERECTAAREVATTSSRETERLTTELASAQLLVDVNRGIAHESYTNGFAAGQAATHELVERANATANCASATANRASAAVEKAVATAEGSLAVATASASVAAKALQERDEARTVLNLALDVIGSRLDGAPELDRLWAVAMALGITKEI